MRKLIALFSFLLICGASFGQLSQFRMIGSGSWSTVNDSTFSSTVTIQSDLTSNGFLPTSITTGEKIFSQTGQRYRISIATGLTFSGADLTIVESGGDWGAPVGQVMIYDPDGRTAVPSIPFGATGATAKMQEAIDSYNSTLIGLGGDVTQLALNDTSAAIRGDFPTGAAIISIPIVQTGVTTASLNLDASLSNIFHIDASANQDCAVTLSSPINGNIYTLQFSGNTGHDTITLNDFYTIDSVGTRDTLGGIYAANSVIQAYYDTAFQIISCIPSCRVKTGGGGGGGPSFDADYQAVLDYATTQGWVLPDDTIQTKQNQLLVDIKASGEWDSLNVFYVFASTDIADSSFSLINWVDPSLNLATNEGGVTYVANEGWQGAGSVSDYIETGLSVSGFDNGSYGGWIHTATTDNNSYLFGTSNDNTASLYMRAHNTVISGSYPKWTTSTPPISGTTSGAGLNSIAQTPDGQVCYLGGTDNGNQTNRNTITANYTLNLLRVNALTPALFASTNVTISAFYAADMFAPTSISGLNTALNTYMSGL